jgi:hypothetical protein
MVVKMDTLRGLVKLDMRKTGLYAQKSPEIRGGRINRDWRHS